MKHYFLSWLVVSGFGLVGTAELVSGQASNAVSVSPAKIAVIHSEMFADQKLGITRFLAVQKKLDEEFKPTRDELAKLRAQIDGLERELRNPPPIIHQKAIGEKALQFERLKREFGFRSNEANTLFEERYAALANPVSEDVSRALAEFAKKNGIDVVIDASKTGGVYVYNNAADMTASFVAFFNAMPTKP